MRVLMTADAVGGVWTYAMELTRALTARGTEVSLATMGPRLSRRHWQEVESTPLQAVYESEFSLEWEHHPWEDVDKAGEWLLELEELVRPDVVHLNGFCHAVLPWAAPTVVAAHSCLLSWWSAVHGRVEQVDPEYRRRVGAGLEAAGAVVAPSRALLDELRRWYGLERGRVVPNCRDAGWFPEPVAGEGKEPLVLSAGRVWDEAKNVAALARIAPRLQWPVVVAGDPAGPDGAAPALPDVHVLGQLPFAELAGWLERAAVFVLPARYEPFGLGPLEAGLAGCALVLGDIPSLREVWGDAAVFVDPGDDQALAAAIDALAVAADQRLRLAAAARERALTYSPARTAAGYLAVYEHVLSELGTLP